MTRLTPGPADNPDDVVPAATPPQQPTPSAGSGPRYPPRHVQGGSTSPAGHLRTFTVWLYYHHTARVFGIASGSTNDMRSKITRAGAHIYDEVTVPLRWHAETLKNQVLDGVGVARCVTPRRMIPIGRTETWLRRSGDTDLAALVRPRAN